MITDDVTQSITHDVRSKKAFRLTRDLGSTHR